MSEPGLLRTASDAREAVAAPLADPRAARQRFRQLATAVRQLSGARSQDDVVEIVRRSARVLSGATGVAIVMRDGDQCHYVAEDAAMPLWQGQRFDMGECVSGWSMLHAAQAIIPDIFTDPRVPVEAYRASGVRSLVMTPIGDPRPFAALGAYWDTVRVHGEDEIAVLDALAHCMATALQTIKLTASLQREARRADDHRMEAERRLQDQISAEAQIRFQASLLDAVNQAVFATDPQGRVLYWNRFAQTLYGWPADEAIGRTLADLITPPQAAAALTRDLAAEAGWIGERLVRRRDGATFPAYLTASPIAGPSGNRVGTVGVSHDNSERREAHRHQQLLINELNHRVRNTLAIVQSIAHQSLRGARSSAEGKAVFEARLNALARAHVLMTDTGWRAVDLEQLLAQALEPFGSRAPGGRFKLEGPAIRLPPRTAVLFSLAIHELCTNAVKYGALSCESGGVEVAWSVYGDEPEARLTLEWRERGGPPVEPPAARGFGSRLIERGLASELGGDVDLRFPPDGVVCRLEAPLPTRAQEALLDLPR